jgi:spermidine/putrescine transport system substrate-binding protein
MKFSTKIATAFFTLLVFAMPAHSAGKLSIYHWFEYIPQELLDKFAAEHDVEVTMDTFDSNEAMLAVLKAGKMGSYDVAVPGDYMVEIMNKDGMLDTFESSELSNFDNMMPEWVDVGFDPGRKSSIPYQWGSTAFSVNPAVYTGDINTWSLMFDPPAELQGKINVLDSQGDILAMAAIYLGIPQCSSDRSELKALNDLLQSAKVHWASFASDSAKDKLVSGDVAASMVWNGVAARARQEGAPVTYAYPKEGYVVWMDNVVLLKDAPNRENAIKFMNFLLDPINAAAVTNFAQYTAGVKGVGPLLSEQVKNSPELNPPALPVGTFVEACTEEVQKVYDTIWLNLKK